ncbi:phosphohydrolase [Pinibacter aurantiacus]|uniref:Phosphohydrolase n=1 Tax=Pinibacter aurantiacus TaxID=2851599 RepID=A0A9E2W466_9BACT|nr:phosphohydrolase [Pinibacter aurantiacus]MBV4357093.1 phosphohydrolase [Pinibacter aurantiacus]
MNLQHWENAFINYLHEHYKSDDAAHDLKHFNRVWKTSVYINNAEGNVADLLVLLAGSYFHDYVTVPKNSLDRSKASKLSADKAVEILQNDFPDFPGEKLQDVAHAIHAHSFSAGIPPQTIEAKILQDADRMEALGAIGLARVFYTAGLFKSNLFHADDPFGNDRTLNDSHFALDHFALKLFKLPALMNTATGKQLAESNVEYLRTFVAKLKREIDGVFD